MLLHLALGDFQPHTRKINDGAVFQLEILRSLEDLQKEYERNASKGNTRNYPDYQARCDQLTC